MRTPPRGFDLAPQIQREQQESAPRIEAAKTWDGSTGRRRGSSASGEVARERILDAATTAFSELGYRGASLATIATSIGITQQGILYHFKSKPSVLQAVLDERDQHGLQNWPTGADLVGTKALDAWDAAVERNAKNFGLVRLAQVLRAEASGADHPAQGYYVDHFEIGMELLLAGFQSGVETGELRPDLDYETIAHQVIAMSEGLESQWLADPGGVDIVACFRAYTKVLRQQIRRDVVVGRAPA